MYRSKGRDHGGKGTRTSRFGVKGREGHDSSPFYSRRLYDEYRVPEPSKADLEEHAVADGLLDKVLLGDARHILPDIPSNSIHPMVTSYPYDVGKEYDGDITLGEYLEFIREVMLEVYRVLVWGGRLCLNIADLTIIP